MIYAYKCEDCSNITELEFSMTEDHPAYVQCEKCSGKSYRYWGSTTVKIPDHFKATSETNGDNSTSLDNLKSRFKHSHPSGKEGKLYY